MEDDSKAEVGVQTMDLKAPLRKLHGAQARGTISVRPLPRTLGYGGLEESGVENKTKSRPSKGKSRPTARHEAFRQAAADGTILLPRSTAVAAAYATSASLGAPVAGAQAAMTGNASNSIGSAAQGSLRGAGPRAHVPKGREGSLTVGRVAERLRRVRRHIVHAQAELSGPGGASWSVTHHLQTALGDEMRVPVPGPWPLGVRVTNLVLEAQQTVREFPRSEWHNAARLGAAALVVHTFAVTCEARAAFALEPFNAALHRVVDVARADFAAALVKFEDATAQAEAEIAAKRAEAIQKPRRKRSKRKRRVKKRGKKQSSAVPPPPVADLGVGEDISFFEAAQKLDIEQDGKDAEDEEEEF